MSSEYYVFSSGGGRQSSAALVLSAHGILPYKTHIFCNTGDDSEDSETLNWVRTTLKPYAKENGIEFLEIRKSGKTLLESIMTTEYSIPIPAKFHYENGKKNLGQRACTVEFKIRTSDRYIKNHFGDLNNPSLVHVGLGITVDEIQRAKHTPIRKFGASGEIKKPTDRVYWLKSQEYPLIFNEPFSIFGRDYGSGLSAKDCSDIVKSAGLGTPPKSACWFCPYHSIGFWKEHANNNTNIYNMGVKLEERLRQKEINMYKKHSEEGKKFTRFEVFLTDAQIPLSVINKYESKKDYDENCESGYCMI